MSGAEIDGLEIQTPTRPADDARQTTCPRSTTIMNPLCHPVLQPFRPCKRFLFIKLARNEPEPSAKAKHAEGIRPSRRQCIARQRLPSLPLFAREALHCRLFDARLNLVGRAWPAIGCRHLMVRKPISQRTLARVWRPLPP